MTHEAVVWAAGLFDGEGCVAVERLTPRRLSGERTTKYRLRVRVRMTHRRTIERLQEIFGFGSMQFQSNKYNPKAADSYVWALQGANANAFLLAVRQHVFTKKEEVDLAVEFYEWNASVRPVGQGGTKAAVLDKRERYYERIRDLKSSNKTRGQVPRERDRKQAAGFDVADLAEVFE